MNPTPKIQYFKTIESLEVQACCQDWKKEFPNMAVMAFVSEASATKVEVIQKASKDLSIPLVGAIFPALVYKSEFQSVGALLVCLPNKPLWHLQSDLPRDKEELSKCIDKISQHLEEDFKESDDTALFMIFDAMVPNISTILDELYIHLGDSVHYMGVNAGSETFKPMKCLFDSDSIVQDGLLTILLSPQSGALLEHGYKAPDETILATTTTGNCITNINWKPAFDVYREHVKKQFDVEITAENFYKYGVHFPFGIIRADGEVLVRIPVMLGEDKSLYCVGEIPENSILTLLNAPKPKSLHTVKHLIDKLEDNPVNLLFYCAGRRMHLEEEATAELKKMDNLTGSNLFAGALSLGEIGSSSKGGYPLFHNATLVVVPLGQSKKQNV